MKAADMRTTELHVGTCAADTGIDELAVTQVAADGMRMHLQGAERDEAIRRMHGRVDTELIAWRASTPPAEPCNESWPATVATTQAATSPANLWPEPRPVPARQRRSPTPPRRKLLP